MTTCHTNILVLMTSFHVEIDFLSCDKYSYALYEGLRIQKDELSQTIYTFVIYFGSIARVPNSVKSSSR